MYALYVAGKNCSINKKRLWIWQMLAVCEVHDLHILVFVTAAGES
jgi:hypothetical protein